MGVRPAGNATTCLHACMHDDQLWFTDQQMVYDALGKGVLDSALEGFNVGLAVPAALCPGD